MPALDPTPHPMLACPLCREPVAVLERELVCTSNHHFDRAKEGFVNLLRPGRARKEVIGDDADMVAARRRFLDRGHYRCLSEGLAALVADVDPTERLLDVGCGEGTFTAAMAPAGTRPAVAMDISRPAVRMSARRAPGALCAVASVIDIPVTDASVDLLASVMSPIHEAEFNRVVHPGSRAVIVRPGASHLNQLRRLVYGHGVDHDEAFEVPGGWRLVEQRRFIEEVELTSNDEVMEVWGMTPYRWNSPREGGDRVAATQELAISVHFVASVWEVC